MLKTDADPKASISEKYTVILLFIRSILIYNTRVSGANEISFIVIHHFLI